MGNWLFKRGRPARPVNRRAVSEQAVGPRRAVVLAASCSALLLAGPARAADINWIDPNGGAFQGAADWSGGVVPGVNDAAFFNLAATYAVTFVGSPTNQRAEFRRGTVSFDLNSNTYTLTASAPGVRSLAVAEDAGDLAALTITDGTVSAALVSVAPATNTRGTLSVGSGGVLNTSNSVFVGLSGGEGTLNVSQGGDVTIGGILTLGGGTDAGGVGGEGRATVSGAGSTLRVDNQFQVGGQRGGSGELTISSGGSVSSTSSTVIGVAAPGLVTVDGTSSTFNVTSTFMTIGSTDLSTLRVRNGGDVVGSTETFLSNSADDSALLHVTGGGSRFATTNRLTVGRFGTGEVLVEAGGAVSTTEGRLSEAAGSSGLATVRGPDSSWTTTGAMRVGQAGTGTLRVLNGATVTSGNSSSVGEGNGTGLAEVSNGGTWTSNSLNVGTGGGGGTVNVGPAGTLSTGTLTLGAAGTVNVDGGTVSVTGLARQAGSVLNFNAGTFDFRSGMTIGTNGPLGDTVVLTPGKTVTSSGSTVSGLLVLDGGVHASSGTVAINSTGEVRLQNPVSRLSIATLVTNSGLISGTGRITGRLSNSPAGEVRVSAGERLNFSGATSANTNTGRLSLLGGEIEFAEGLTNSGGVVFLRDGTLTGRSTLVNDGLVGGRGVVRATQFTNNAEVQFSAGVSDVFAPLTNAAGARVIVSGGGTASFYSPVTNNAGSEFRVSDDSRAVFFSSVSGAAAFTGAGTKYFEEGSPSLGAVQTAGHSVVAARAAVGATRFREKSLTVEGRVSIAAGGGAAGTSAVDSLVLAGAPGGWTGTLDLADHAMVVRDGDFGVIRDQVRDGRDGGGGITSSLIDQRHGVGVIANGAAGEALYQSFEGVGSLAGGEVLLRFTLRGDSDLDGDVGNDDLLRLRRSMGGRRPGDWSDGDFDYDGRVTARDMFLLRQNLGLSMPAGAALVAGEVAVPEPGSLGAIFAGMALLARRRRR